MLGVVVFGRVLGRHVSRFHVLEVHDFGRFGLDQHRGRRLKNRGLGKREQGRTRHGGEKNERDEPAMFPREPYVRLEGDGRGIVSLHGGATPYVSDAFPPNRSAAFTSPGGTRLSSPRRSCTSDAVDLPSETTPSRDASSCGNPGVKVSTSGLADLRLRRVGRHDVRRSTRL